MRRTLHAALCAPALALTIASVAAQQLLELTLEVGEQRVISSEGVSSYSEGVAGIVDVRLTKDGSSFVIVGQRPGRTSLLFMLSDGRQAQYRIVVNEANRAGAGLPGQESGAVKARDNVRLDFYFVELSQDNHTRIGMTWPASLGSGSVSASFDLMSGSFTDATAVVSDQALPRLDLAQARGWAKLLRQAAVITANGSEANFSGGGELNIPVQTALSVGVRQIAFGSQIKVLPRYDRESGRIELAIHAEVSDLTSDRGSGIPGRVLSSLDSVVNLELGQSLVLAGLTAQSESSSKTGIPGLSQIPILGPLFGSHERRSERSENLIVIVPTVVDAVSLDARERVRDALELFSAYDGHLDETPLRAVPLPGAAAHTASTAGKEPTR
jgi:pilus assembly protein CpaC